MRGRTNRRAGRLLSRATYLQPRLFTERLESRRLLANAIPTAAASSQAVELLAASPAVFVENAGQWDSSVRFVQQSSGANIALTDTGATFQLYREKDPSPASASDRLDPRDADRAPPEMITTQFSVGFDGANATSPIGQDRSESSFNFFLGDQTHWRSDVAGFASAVYPNLYDGIDLVTSGRRDALKYEFRVAPGSDYQQIRVRYDGVESLSIDPQGRLHARLGGAWDDEVIEEKPFIYQLVDGKQVEVEGAYRVLDDLTYGFELVGDFDPSSELVIDPELTWSSYLGGSGLDYGSGIATDAAGNAWVTGSTYSSGWTSGGFDTTYNNNDAFIAKINANGTLAWSTYLGGSSSDYGDGIATDAAGNAWVTGQTNSVGWTSGGFDTTYNGGYSDAFIAKINANGTLAWSSYLGGSNTDEGSEVATDAAGNAWVAGSTLSAGWTSGGFDTALDGSVDGFIAKINANGTLASSSYLGGSGFDYGYGIATDAAGNAWVTGQTSSTGWASGGFDITKNGGRDGFVAKINASGTLAWSTYLGGSSDDSGSGIATDAAGNAWVMGSTYSSGWTSGGFDTTYNGDDAFIAKINANGTLAWSSYLGGSSWDYGSGIATDAAGNAWAMGKTSSTGWVSGGFDITHNGRDDAFIAKINANGTLAWSSYLGGASDDSGSGIATDAAGNAWVTGQTSSAGWVSGGFDTVYGGSDDGFIAKITDLVPGVDLIGGNVTFAPAATSSGGPVNITFRIRNIGSVAAAATQARLRLSADTNLTLYDKPLSPLDVNIPAIPAGAVLRLQRSLHRPRRHDRRSVLRRRLRRPRQPRRPKQHHQRRGVVRDHADGGCTAECGGADDHSAAAIVEFRGRRSRIAQRDGQRNRASVLRMVPQRPAVLSVEWLNAAVPNRGQESGWELLRSHLQRRRIGKEQHGHRHRNARSAA